MQKRGSIFIFVCVLAFAGVLLTSACSTAYLKKEDIREEHLATQQKIESRILELEERQARTDSLLEEQIRLINGLRAYIGQQTQEQNRNIAMISARQDDINFIMEQLLEKTENLSMYGGSGSSLAPSNVPSPPPSLLDEVPEDDEARNLYSSALAEIEQENFDAAGKLFMSFLLQYPDHTLSPNAQYWLGEAAYGQRKYAEAIQHFEEVRTKYPNSNKSAASLLKIGLAQVNMGEINAGRTTLKKVISQYRDSDEAKIARDRLNRL